MLFKVSVQKINMDNPQNEINNLSDQIPIRIKRISRETEKTGYSYTQTAQKNIYNNGFNLIILLIFVFQYFYGEKFKKL